jgi:NIMA (never in mitosis gene a)-related kinase
MEYADGGDLMQRIEEKKKKCDKFKEEEIWKTFVQMVRGLKILHAKKILHRDLKVCKIIISSVPTFSYAKMELSSWETSMSQKLLRKAYCILKLELLTMQGNLIKVKLNSPEVWKDRPYDSKSDIWSLGCVLYEMTALRPPYMASDMQGLYKKVLKGK